MRTLSIALVLSFACASTREEGRSASETPSSATEASAPAGAKSASAAKDAAQPGAGAQEKSAATARDGAAAPHGAAQTATTAAESASAYAREHGGGGGDVGGKASSGGKGAGGSDVGGKPAGAQSSTARAAASGAGPADDSCQTDADCGFTRVGEEPSACCPMLCAPRVVSKKHAGELDQRIASCNSGHECPQPSCRPPPTQVRPACEANRCVGKPMKPASKED